MITAIVNVSHRSVSNTVPTPDEIEVRLVSVVSVFGEGMPWDGNNNYQLNEDVLAENFTRADVQDIIEGHVADIATYHSVTVDRTIVFGMPVELF